MSLQISKTLSLPDDAVTQTFAILARKSAGKSYAAGVIAEEMNKNGLPFVWVDPVGAAFGFRSSADGKRPGLPIVILGGDHGDIPLTPETGEQVAKFIVSENVSILLDLSLMRKAEQIRFMTGYCEAMYHLNKHPRHLFVDETDLFAPQRPFPEGMRLLGAIEDIVRRGRIKGLGFTTITQRAAVVSKDILTQTECLIVLQTTGPQDKKAVKEWVNVHVDDPNSAQVVEFERSLPNLQKGQAWVWSPAWLQTFQLVQIRQKETFDSSATPKPGQLSAPKVVADVDLGKLQDQMAVVIEQHKASDPVALRKRVAELEAKLEKAENAPVRIEPDPKLIAENEELRAFIRSLGGKLEQLAGQFAGGVEQLHRLTHEAQAKGVLPPRLVDITRDFPKRPEPTVMPPKPQRVKPAVSVAYNGHLGSGERRLLIAIAQYPEGATREQLTLLTGLARSTRDRYIQYLQQKGLVCLNPGGAVAATDEGVTVLGPDFKPLPTGVALQQYWLSRLPGSQADILREAIKAFPRAVSRDFITSATGLARSTRDRYIQYLQARKLVETDGKGAVKASGGLF